MAAVERTCEVCGGAFRVKPHVVREGHGRFCSTACRIAGTNSGARVERICEVCGAQFLAWRSAISRGFGRTCSVPCRNVILQRGGMINRTCEQCGAPFRAMRAHVQRGWGRFCSQVCKYTARRGSGHPRYKGGRRVMPTGYVSLSVTGRGQVLEHRLVMETQLGRPLKRTEHVHHLNGDRADNRPENLEVMTRDEHLDKHPHSRHKAGWSRLYERCIDCGTTDIPHKARGRCKRCQYKAWRRGEDGA